MITACVAIIIMVFISSFMCIRRGHNKLGYSILPVAMVPFGHLIGGRLLLLLRTKSIVPEMAAMSIVTAVDVAALVAGSAIIIAFSQSFFHRTKTRGIYCTVIIAFTAILTLVLLLNYYGEIL
ncbi:MAG: hypothetical protein II828_00355 [Clostridia bacterium]|nr:hypothetical protein [Clostridia bacterium]